MKQGYLLGSTTPKGLWSHNFGKSVWCHLNSLLGEPVEQLAAGGRKAAVEAKGKLVEVVIQMVVRDGALVRAE